MCKESIALSWSGGKDCSYALYLLLKENRYDIKFLVSTFNEDTKALNMHGVPVALIEAQAESTGIPLLKIFVSNHSNATYNERMSEAFSFLKTQGIQRIAFGDIFLTDLRVYREQQLTSVDMQCIFPLWMMDTTKLVNDFIGKGFKAYTCCVQDVLFTKEYAGVLITHDFIDALPSNIDPCGENGEYHSFCFDGPVFKKPVAVTRGRKALLSLPLQKEQLNFWFCEMTG